MNTKHTPGPWKFMERGLLVKSDESEVVGTFHKANKNEANARLIAAAPELLAALERVAALDNGFGVVTGLPLVNAVMDARAAIAKARG